MTHTERKEQIKQMLLTELLAKHRYLTTAAKHYGINQTILFNALRPERNVTYETFMNIAVMMGYNTEVIVERKEGE